MIFFYIQKFENFMSNFLMSVGSVLDAGGVELSGESSKDPTARNALGDWVVWWKSQVDHQDYLRFLAASESDYMALLFHLYRDEDELAASMKGDSDSEDEYLKNPNDSVLQMLPPKSREKNAKVS